MSRNMTAFEVFGFWYLIYLIGANLDENMFVIFMENLIDFNPRVKSPQHLPKNRPSSSNSILAVPTAPYQ